MFIWKNAFVALSTIVLLLFGPTTQANSYSFQKKSAAWVISGEKDSITHEPILCLAGTKNKRKSRLGLALSESIEGLMVIITTNNWYKLKGDRVTLNFKTNLGKSGQISGTIIEKGKIHLNTKKAFIETLKSAKNISFNQNLFVEEFNLTGSYQALTRLEECADKNKDLSQLPTEY